MIRLTSPTRTPVVEEEIKNPQPEILRLCVHETWQLSNLQVDLRFGQLSQQGGSDSSDLWASPTTWLSGGSGPDIKEKSWVPQACEINRDCEGYTIWCLPPLDSRERPWILLAEQTKDRGVRCTLQSAFRQYTEKVLAIDDRLQGGGSEYKSYHRLAVFEYYEKAAFSCSSTLRHWTHSVLQDNDGSIAEAILEDLRHSEGRGLLRHVGRRSDRFVLDRRISWPQDNSVPERMVTGFGDDSESEGSSKVENEESSMCDSEQLFFGGVLQQSSRKRQIEVADTVESPIDSGVDPTPRHKRLRRSSRRSGLRNHK